MTFKIWAEGLTSGVNLIVPLLFACAFVAFIWGVVNYFFIQFENETKRKEGREFVMWGILGMVLILSIWGVVHLLLSTLGFGN